MGEQDTRLWRVDPFIMSSVPGRAPTFSLGVTRVAIDETAARRGHNYITLFVDIDNKARVVYATEGKDAATVAAFADDLAAHRGDPDAIAEVSSHRHEPRIYQGCCRQPAQSRSYL